MNSALINNSRSIIRKAIEKANRSNMKYNMAHSMHVEELTGEPNDRTPYDVGTEPEYRNFDH
jgi:hypothetical protein